MQTAGLPTRAGLASVHSENAWAPRKQNHPPIVHAHVSSVELVSSLPSSPQASDQQTGHGQVTRQVEEKQSGQGKLCAPMGATGRDVHQCLTAFGERLRHAREQVR
eukprot:15456707-Alexandrium_andersonii.AAC.1